MRTIIIIFLTITFSVLLVFGQVDEFSEASRILKAKLDLGNNTVILEAGDSNDKSLIPFLKQLASKKEYRSSPNAPSFMAHVALAKLGDQHAMQDILAEIDDVDPWIQNGGMEKLSLIGGKIAYAKLYQLLDDTRPRENPDCKKDLEQFKELQKKHPEVTKCSFCCDEGFFNRSTTVIDVFLTIFKDYPDIPPRYKKGRGAKWQAESIILWKEWFAKHKELIE